MLKVLSPLGSRWQAQINDFVVRIKIKHKRKFHVREYDDYLQEYYRIGTWKATKLRGDDAKD